MHHYVAFIGRINSAADLIRNIMQAVAGHIVPAGISTTTITTPNLPTAGGPQTNPPHDGNTNAGQNTQARYVHNVVQL